MVVTQEIEQRAQQAAQAGADHWPSVLFPVLHPLFLAEFGADIISSLPVFKIFLSVIRGICSIFEAPSCDMLQGKVSNFLRTSRFSSIDKTILFGVIGLLLLFSVPGKHGISGTLVCSALFGVFGINAISAFLFTILTA